MDPGRAFGTGHHETTRLCLEWLEDCSEALQASGRLLGQTSLLDVGTGSGILCMAAALLGFQPVTGIDNDPEAIEVALENLELNRLSSRVELREATVAETSGRYAVVIANIQTIPLVEMASDMVRCLAPSGKLGLSGILLEQQDEVRTAYEGLGLRCVETRTAGEWCLLAFES
jgi:ribosomal protein L11 methyltransferase